MNQHHLSGIYKSAFSSTQDLKPTDELYTLVRI